MKWPDLMALIQSNTFMTNSLHFWAAVGVVGTASNFMPWWYAALWFLLSWAMPKEIIFDRVSWGENHGKADWTDLKYYVLGTAAVCVVLGIKSIYAL